MTKPVLKLIETKIAEKTIGMRLTDGTDPPLEWIEFQVIPADYEFENRKLSESPDRMPVAISRLAALRRVQDAIAAETARLSALLRGQTS